MEGNLATLTKVDKLRELIGNRIPLPQLVVVGDQSSGKSSVLEGITGFAFPRAAELCTRYVTQITCRREEQGSVAVSIIPHEDADPAEAAKMRAFRETLVEVNNEKLAEIFKKANDIMGLRIGTVPGTGSWPSSPAFSEHILKIEICGPEVRVFPRILFPFSRTKCLQQEHFTVIDVPGIFRKETDGVTTEDDIELVRKMVKRNMENNRTIILAIIPSNVDPATQEILKLAKQVDPKMTRTMGVLTKPDLNIERTTQQIAIDHVTGKRCDLTLGYYIVKNRGSDDLEMTLEEGLQKEQHFFSGDPWRVLRSTGRAGILALKDQVRELLAELIKKQFSNVRGDVNRELASLRVQRDAMGISRSSTHAQRTYLNGLSDKFQAMARDARHANYISNEVFSSQNGLRLITRIVEASEAFANAMERDGHTRPFSAGHKDSSQQPIPLSINQHQDDADLPDEWRTVSRKWVKKPSDPKPLSPNDHLPTFAFSELKVTTANGKAPMSKSINCTASDAYPELQDILEFSWAANGDHCDEDGIMAYIERVHSMSRGSDLATFGSSLLPTIFKDQSRNWEPLTMAYVSRAIVLVHHFVHEALVHICPDKHVCTELWDNHLLERLQEAYRRARDQAKFLLQLERDGQPHTMNHYFNDNLQTSQNERTVSLMKNVGTVDDSGIHLTFSQLDNLSVNKANSEHVREYIHDVLKSYYEVAIKRFVDTVGQQVVLYLLLDGDRSPLQIFTSKMVMELNDDQLDMIAGEDASVRAQRDKLDTEIKAFQEALSVLRGSS